MKVILREHVKSLGNVGDIVSVTSGYARNFLFPRKLAFLADEGNKSIIEDYKRRLSKKINDQKEVANNLKKQLEGLSFDIVKRVGGNGKLFGAVTASDLASELKSRNIEVEKKWIHLDNPIKELGTFSIAVKIFADVEAKFSIKVLMDPKQIEENKEKQANKKSKVVKEEVEEKKVSEGDSEFDGEESETMTSFLATDKEVSAKPSKKQKGSGEEKEKKESKEPKEEKKSKGGKEDKKKGGKSK